MKESKGYMNARPSKDSKKQGQEEKDFEGETTEEAIVKAEEAIGLDREKMDIKVVCEEQKGLFGMKGAKAAKIKVYYKR